MSRSLLVAVVAALAVVAPAAAAQAAPTLSFDQPCYSEGDTMVFSGSGYTPGGAVDMFISSLATQQAGSLETAADPAGAISGRVNTPEADRYIGENDWATQMGAAANDRTRVEAGAGPEEAVGFTTFRFSRFDVQLEQPSGARPRAAKRMMVTAKGFTEAKGETLYVHYRRSRRTMKTVKVGRLTGICGDRTRTLARGLPRGLRPGRYELTFNTSRRDPQALPRVRKPLSLR
jgi:hypothetical protein